MIFSLVNIQMNKQNVDNELNVIAGIAEFIDYKKYLVLTLVRKQKWSKI